MKALKIYKFEEVDIEEFKKIETDETTNYGSFDDIQTINNVLAKRIILLSKENEIIWNFETDLLPTRGYTRFVGIGTKGKTINFKYVLYIHTEEIDKSYLMYVAKNSVNDWAHLYHADVYGKCYNCEELELFIKIMLDVFKEKKLLYWC